VTPLLEDADRADLARRPPWRALELLSNAIKHDRPDDHVTLCAESGPIDRLTIRVLDDGIGIDPTRLDKLFQPFQRLGAEDGEVAGTGGLTVTKSTIDAMGGHVDVQTALGAGTAVTITVERTAPPPASEEGPSPALPSWRPAAASSTSRMTRRTSSTRSRR